MSFLLHACCLNAFMNKLNINILRVLSVLERQNQMYRFCSNIKKQEKSQERMMSKGNDIFLTFKTNLCFIADHDHSTETDENR